MQATFYQGRIGKIKKRMQIKSMNKNHYQSVRLIQMALVSCLNKVMDI